MVNAEYNVLGTMSGTSLDGLDLAHCSFRREEGEWKYSLNASVTVPYPENLALALRKAMHVSGKEIAQLHVDLGIYFGRECAKFLEKIALPTLFIASHGHTVFHQPDQGLTLQIGSGAHIAAEAHLSVVADFRTLDVALGGNGAPLVPIGDAMLFRNYDVCLNLGGIANLSYEEDEARKAFDVCPFNIIFNHLAEKMGQSFDRNGELTASGKTDAGLLERLSALDLYMHAGPRSLGREWIDCKVIPLLEASAIAVEDQMHTFCEHAAVQLSTAFPAGARTILVTGGGAYHRYFVQMLQRMNPHREVILPGDDIIQFKEALIFAFLGVLRWRGEVNCLSSVTGASRDNIGGVVYLQH